MRRRPALRSILQRLPLGETPDLFDLVRVTWDDVLVWCALVAGIDADSPRLAQYVTGWNVPAKVAAAKLAGAWPPSIPSSQSGRLADLLPHRLRPRALERRRWR